MYRLEGIVGERIRLIQRTMAATITIRSQDDTIVVRSEPTIKRGSLSIRFYDFVPMTQGTYFIHWDGARPDQEWEVIDVKPNSLRWLINRVKDKTDELPPAETG